MQASEALIFAYEQISVYCRISVKKAKLLRDRRDVQLEVRLDVIG